MSHPSAPAAVRDRSDRPDEGLEIELAALLDAALAEGLASAASVAVLHEGRVVAEVGGGWLASHDDAGHPIEPADRATADASTWFDLASITKLYSAITLHTLIGQGALTLDQPVASLLPGWRGDPDRERVLLSHLLTHTSGLPDIYPGWQAPLQSWVRSHPGQKVIAWPVDDVAGRRAELEAMPLAAAPQTRYSYSCVGFNTAMLLAEASTERPWAELVSSLVLGPLGVAVDFTPHGPVAATEVEPELGRGAISGQVHDEFSWALGGRCANAGLFGTARGVAATVDRLRNDTLPSASAPLWDNQIPRLLGRDLCDPVDSPWGHSLGLRIGQQSWMSELGGRARGHTGFTGTSVFTDREAGLTVALMTNRVHPTRDSADTNPLRAAVARAGYRFAGLS